MDNAHRALLAKIVEKKALDDALRAEIDAVIKEFKERFVAEQPTAKPRMPSLIDIRRRIRSVRNTQQITKAMKMVSAAKLRRAQDRVIASRPYGAALRGLLADVAAAAAVDETRRRASAAGAPSREAHAADADHLR